MERTVVPYLKMEDLYEMVQKDLQIDHDKLDEESGRTWKIHDKYLKMYLSELNVLRRMERRFKNLLKDKTHYYLGKADPEVYRQKPFDLKVKPIKSDLNLYLEADADMQHVQDAIDDQDIKVKYLKETLTQINQRGFQVRDSIEWQKFKHGLN